MAMQKAVCQYVYVCPAALTRVVSTRNSEFLRMSLANSAVSVLLYRALLDRNQPPFRQGSARSWMRC